MHNYKYMYLEIIHVKNSYAHTHMYLQLLEYNTESLIYSKKSHNYIIIILRYSSIFTFSDYDYWYYNMKILQISKYLENNL